jgi:hypothetical protein
MKIFSSSLRPRPADRPTVAGEGRKCGELFRALETMQQTHFRRINTGDEGRF